jgi:hypothetical protein
LSAALQPATETTAAETAADGLVVGVYKDGSFASAATEQTMPASVREAIVQQLRQSDTKGKLGEVRVLYGIATEVGTMNSGTDAGTYRRVAVVGLGSRPKTEDASDMIERARFAVGERWCIV